MLRPRSQRAEDEWANTVRHKGQGMCFKHWQQAAIAEERLSARLRTRWGSPEMTIRGSAAVVFWPLPAEGTWLGREKRDLERWARTELERLRYRVMRRAATSRSSRRSSASETFLFASSHERHGWRWLREWECAVGAASGSVAGVDAFAAVGGVAVDGGGDCVRRVGVGAGGGVLPG